MSIGPNQENLTLSSIMDEREESLAYLIIRKVGSATLGEHSIFLSLYSVFILFGHELCALAIFVVEFLDFFSRAFLSLLKDLTYVIFLALFAALPFYRILSSGREPLQF